MLVLVTRPREQAEATARLLRAAGHEVLIDPILDIRPLPPPRVEPGEVAALAITSANAASALAELPADLPVFAVGEATAEAARAAGRRIVEAAAGDGSALAGLIRRSVAHGGVVLHLCGRDVREGLEAGLVAAGYAYRQAPVYEAIPSPALATETVDAIRGRRLNAILFYSPRSATLFADKVAAAGLAQHLSPVLAVCLSEAVAAGLAGLPFRAVRVAAARDQKALLRCLDGGG
jgi:uroporphyrinogen-III synthase